MFASSNAVKTWTAPRKIQLRRRWLVRGEPLSKIFGLMRARRVGNARSKRYAIHVQVDSLPCNSLTRTKMIDAGWCYNPIPEADDCVMCFYCGISLEGWEPKDDPWYVVLVFCISNSEPALITRPQGRTPSQSSRLFFLQLGRGRQKASDCHKDQEGPSFEDI